MMCQGWHHQFLAVRGELGGAASCLSPFCNPDVSDLAEARTVRLFVVLAEEFLFLQNI